MQHVDTLIVYHLNISSTPDQQLNQFYIPMEGRKVNGVKALLTIGTEVNPLFDGISHSSLDHLCRVKVKLLGYALIITINSLKMLLF